MISGFKIGLLDWEEKLEECQKLTGAYPAYVEIYFRVDKISLYRPMFEFLARNQIKNGLHFWGMLKNSLEPNLLSKQKWIQNQSVMLIQSAIKVAHEQKSVYVNVHPGSLKERIINLDDKTYQVGKYPETSFDEARENLLENAERLRKISEKHGVLLIYETLPTNCPKNWIKPHDQNNILIVKSCPIEFYDDLVKNGHFVANDFGHTSCSIDMEKSDFGGLSQNEKREYVRQRLMDWTKKLAKQTRLIHSNLTLPPFDGVDVHAGLKQEDFDKNPLPNREELMELLLMFKNRDDVFVINEPESDHVENYVELVGLIKSI